MAIATLFALASLLKITCRVSKPRYFKCLGFFPKALFCSLRMPLFNRVKDPNETVETHGCVSLRAMKGFIVTYFKETAGHAGTYGGVRWRQNLFI